MFYFRLKHKDKPKKMRLLSKNAWKEIDLKRSDKRAISTRVPLLVQK